MKDNPDSNTPESSTRDSQQADANQTLGRGRKVWLTITLTLLVGTLGGLTYAWYYIQNKLAPQIEASLSKAFNRPIKLGQIQDFTFTGLRLGATEIPPTPTDPDRVSVRAIQVNFNPLLLLTDRILKLELTLIEPNAYIEQDKNKQWISVKLAQSEEKGPIEIDLATVRVEDGEAIVVSRAQAGSLQQPVNIDLDRGLVYISDKYQKIDFQLRGQLADGGDVQIKGNSIIPEGQLPKSKHIILISGSNLDGGSIGRLLPLPIEAKSGKIDSNLEVVLAGTTLAAVNGEATLNQVTARVEKLPQPFNQSNGKLKFAGKVIVLEQIETLFGKIPAVANGSVDLDKGFNLKAKTAPITLKIAIETFKTQKIPIPLNGEVQTNLSVTGGLEEPVVNAQVVATKPIQVDRVTLRDVKADVVTTISAVTIKNFQGNPTLGGKVSGTGQLTLGTETPRINFNFRGQNLPADALATLYEQNLPVALGAVSTQLNIAGTPDKVENLRVTGSANSKVAGGTVNVTNIQLANQRWQARVVTEGLKIQQLAENIPSQLTGLVNSNVTVRGNLDRPDVKNISAAGVAELNSQAGRVRVTNLQLAGGNWQAAIAANNVRLGVLSPQIPPQLSQPLDGTFNLQGTIDNPTVEGTSVNGTANLNVAGGNVRVNGNLANQRFAGTILASGVQLNRFSDQIAAGSPASGRLSFTGTIDDLEKQQISARAEGVINVAKGQIRATDFSLANRQWQGTVSAIGVRLNQLSPQISDTLAAPFNGKFNLAGNLDNPGLSGISASGQANIAVAGGQISGQNLSVANGQWQGSIVAANVSLDRLTDGLNNQALKQVSPALKGGKINGNFQIAGNLEPFSQESITGSGSGALTLARGVVRAENVQLSQGNFNGTVIAQGVALRPFSENLQGDLTGEVDFSGNLANLTPSGIQANANLNLSEGGSALIDRPTTASLSWNGQRLAIANISAEDKLQASGFVDLNLAKSGINAIEQLNLDVSANQLDLAGLPVPIGEAVSQNLRDKSQPIVAGYASFDGNIAGKPTAPQVNGNLELADFSFAGIKFDPQMQGTVALTPTKEVKIDIQGNSENPDQIQLFLAQNYQPQSLLIKQDEIAIEGQRQGDTFDVNARDIPLEAVKDVALLTNLPLNRAISARDFAGKVSAEVAVNLNTLGKSGTLPTFEATASVEGAQVQQILLAAQIFELSDLGRGLKEPTYARSNDLYTNTTDANNDRPVVSVGLSSQQQNETPLLTQLRRFSEIEALLKQQRQKREDAAVVPEIRELQGTINGSVAVSNSPQSGPRAQFNFLGGTPENPWTWGQYSAKSVGVNGNFANGVLKLDRARIELLEGEAVEVAATLGKQTSASIKLENIPISLVREFVDLPTAIGFDGLINANATIERFPQNPIAIGAVNLKDASINETPIQSAQGSFTYKNSRLDFLVNSVVAEQAEPVIISGSIPYQLPTVDIEPDSDRLELTLAVKDKGLALLNVLSRGQLTWVDGQGDVGVTVTGRFNQQQGRPTQLTAEGTARIENATIAAQALAEQPLTQVNGDISFNFDDISVEKLQGNFGGGQISVAGVLPLSQPASVNNPLTVNLDRLALNLKGLYNGSVRGQVQIKGSALEPSLSGGLELFDGQVLLAESAGGNSGTGGGSGDNSQQIELEYDNLELTLGDNVQVIKPPIMAFQATGDLRLRGTLYEPNLDGIVQLERGQVNLFTTQFRLARGYEQTAQFIPERGLDPILNVRLIASVTETTRQPISSDPLSAEVALDERSPTDIGALGTVRVEARVDGPASQITENLELTSTPRRSETEIVGLLGGSFVQTLGRADSTLGLANLAGSAVLGTFQDAIGNALGLSEFRLFPTLITDEENRNSTLGLGAEVGVDITKRLSVSTFKIINSPQPFQYGVRYRLNDQILLRGSTDFSGDSRAAVEYETRF